MTIISINRPIFTKIITISKIVFFLSLCITLLVLTSKAIDVSTKDVSELKSQLLTMQILAWTLLGSYSLFYCFEYVQNGKSNIFTKTMYACSLTILMLIILVSNYISALKLVGSCNIEAVQDLINRTYTIVLTIMVTELVLYSNTYNIVPLFGNCLKKNLS